MTSTSNGFLAELISLFPGLCVPTLICGTFADVCVIIFLRFTCVFLCACSNSQVKQHIIEKLSTVKVGDIQTVLQLSSVLKEATAFSDGLVSPDSMVNTLLANCTGSALPASDILIPFLCFPEAPNSCSWSVKYVFGKRRSSYYILIKF